MREVFQGLLTQDYHNMSDGLLIFETGSRNFNKKETIYHTKIRCRNIVPLRMTSPQLSFNLTLRNTWRGENQNEKTNETHTSDGTKH